MVLPPSVWRVKFYIHIIHDNFKMYIKCLSCILSTQYFLVKTYDQVINYCCYYTNRLCILIVILTFLIVILYMAVKWTEHLRFT